MNHSSSPWPVAVRTPLSPANIQTTKVTNTPSRQQIITNFTPKSKSAGGLSSRIPYFFSNKWDAGPSPLKGINKEDNQIGDDSSLSISISNLSSRRQTPNNNFLSHYSMSTQASPSKSQFNVVQMMPSPYSPSFTSPSRHNSSFKFQSFLPSFTIPPISPTNRSRDNASHDSDVFLRGKGNDLDSPTESSVESGEI